ncbi:hypothetical protein E4T39_03895 [Aureobasidium subglaciale]|nr:hypothetical protein E4T39_03895 [Aureobasidium subglaciale]
MATSPPPLAGRLAYSLLHTLADLNSEDKLLGISAIFNSTIRVEERAFSNAIGLFITMLSQGLLISLIRHIMLRTVGTLLVASSTQTYHESHKAKPNYFNSSLFHQITFSPRRLRQDILQGVIYNVLYLILSGLLSLIFSSYIWSLVSRAIAALFLANYHARWTRGILSLPQMRRSTLSWPSRELVIPCSVYMLAGESTAGLPGLVSRLLSLNVVDGTAKIETIAAGDGLVLMIALAMRLLVLYPAFAAYVYVESKHAEPGNSFGGRDCAPAGETKFPAVGLKAYSDIVSLCFTKTAPWLALLHFQTVLVIAAVKVLALPVIYKMAF